MQFKAFKGMTNLVQNVCLRYACIQVQFCVTGEPLVNIVNGRVNNVLFGSTQYIHLLLFQFI